MLRIEMAARTEPGFERAARLANWGRWRTVRKECRAILKEKPGDPRASALLAYALGATRRLALEDAQRRAQIIATEHPEMPEPRMADGTLSFQLGHHQIAIPLLRDLVAQFPGDAGARATLAGCLAQRREAPEALEHYREAARMGPLPGPAHRDCAYRVARGMRADPETRRAVIAGADRVERLVHPLGLWGRWLALAWGGALGSGTILHLWPLLVVASALAAVLVVVGFHLCTFPLCVLLWPLTTLAGWFEYPTFADSDAATTMTLVAFGALIYLVYTYAIRARLGRTHSAARRGSGPWPPGIAPPAFAVIDGLEAKDTPPPPVRKQTVIGAIAIATLAVAVGFRVWSAGPPAIPSGWPAFRASGAAWSIRYPPGWTATPVPDSLFCSAGVGVMIASSASEVVSSEPDGCPDLLHARLNPDEVLIVFRRLPDFLAGFALLSPPGVSNPPPHTHLPVRLSDVTAYGQTGGINGFILVKTHGHYYEVDALLGTKAWESGDRVADLIIASISFDP